jgi:cephalosporin hydroxylase
VNFDFIKGLDGWTTPEKAQVLYDLAIKAKPDVAVEIGVFGGRGTIAIAHALKRNGKGKIIAIDPWSADASAKAQIDPQSEEWWGKVDHERVYKNFLWHLKKQQVEQFVEVMRDSSQATKVPEKIGLLIVDGNHNEEALLDAKRFAPSVVLGGYCLLDDLDWVGGYVRQAEEYIKSIGFSFVKLLDGQTGLYQRMEIADPSKAVAEAVEDRKIVPDKARLTVAYFTGRQQPNFAWFIDSLRNQMETSDRLDVITVDFLNESRLGTSCSADWSEEIKGIRQLSVPPKPNIWQGKYRITKEDYWAKSNAINTAIVMCETEWLACLDDRCVLMPGWLEAVKRAMAGNYAVCGSYQKRSKMEVENGFIKGYDKLIGEDPRIKQAPNGIKNCPGGWFFGCSYAAPLEWLLQVNGAEEGMDSLSMEDCILGQMLKNNGFQMNFDPQMRMIEDRTEGELSSGHDVGGNLKRMDKGISPNDKSHAALERFGKLKRTEFTPDLRNLREQKIMPVPDISVRYADWYDDQDIRTL